VAALAKLDVVRVTLDQQDSFELDADAGRIEYWIDDIENFMPSPRLRRDLAYARRALGSWRMTEGISCPGACYELYASVVERRQGKVVYTKNYFEKLAVACRPVGWLGAWSLLDEGGELRGFSVFARNGPDGYYLHAAADSLAKKHGAGDALLERVVHRAKSEGCSRLSLMASPWQQEGLLRFKNKWAMARRFAVTRHWYRGAVGLTLATWFRWQLRLERSHALVANQSGNSLSMRDRPQ
jgi:GNAT superfamily N-acetyltransferase